MSTGEEYGMDATARKAAGAPRSPGSNPRGFVVECAAFTLIELLVVISIIAVLSSLVVGLAGMASRKSKETRVRAELNQLMTAIDGYYAKLGFYPPDNHNAVNLNLSAVTNQLFYELAGVVMTNLAFVSPSHDEKVSSGDVKTFFNTDGFANSARSERELRFKTVFKKGQYTEISDTNNPSVDIDVLIVPVPWPVNDPNPPVPGRKGLNPWRYVSSSPTNNPGKYDLWAEFIVGGKKLIIGNWSRDTIVVEQ